MDAQQLSEQSLGRPISHGQRVCFFAHYDVHNIVDPLVYRYLQQVRDAGFLLIFVTTSCLSEQDQDSLRELCHDVIMRDNKGLDFGSWQLAWEKYQPQLSGDLLLANDSVYGPLGELANTLERLQEIDADYYGLVESCEHQPHLQSWFLLLRPHVYRSQGFQSTFKARFNELTKEQIIQQGEIGLSHALLAAGFTPHALYMGTKGSRLMRARPGNPMHWIWIQLIREYKVPFVKIELLRDNVLNLPEVNIRHPSLKGVDPGVVGLIENHLKRCPPRISPERERALSRLHSALLMKLYQAKSGGGAWIAFALAYLLGSVVSAVRSVSLWLRAHKQQTGRDDFG